MLDLAVEYIKDLQNQVEVCYKLTSLTHSSVLHQVHKFQKKKILLENKTEKSFITFILAPPA